MTVDHLVEADLVSWLQRLVRYPSEQSDLQESDPAIAGFIQDCAGALLKEIGANFRLDEMGNLIAEFGPDSGESLMFVAYAMTHPAARMSDPFSGSIIETERGLAVRGRGVAEQKTALAAVLGALHETLRHGQLRGKLTLLLLTSGETGRHDAIRAAMTLLATPPRFAVVCIGTSCRIAVGNKGRIDFDAVVKGRASHSSAPWHGINAITGARRVLEALENFRLDTPTHPNFGPATLTPTAIESAPRATHTVPDTVRITFDRRLLPGENAEEAYRAISGAISVEQPWSVECQLGPVMYPNEIAIDGPLMRRLRAAFAVAGQPDVEHFYCNFALDAGYLASLGIEAVMLGPGEIDQFHSNEESVLVSDLTRMANVYYGIIQQCLVRPD